MTMTTATAEAAAVDRIQAAATTRCPEAMSSEASLVATPLQPNARPAPSIVTIALERGILHLEF